MQLEPHSYVAASTHSLPYAVCNNTICFYLCVLLKAPQLSPGLWKLLPCPQPPLHLHVSHITSILAPSSCTDHDMQCTYCRQRVVRGGPTRECQFAMIAGAWLCLDHLELTLACQTSSGELYDAIWGVQIRYGANSIAPNLKCSVWMHTPHLISH